MSLASPLSPEQQAVIAGFQKTGQALALWHVGSFCIFGWDSLICLQKEIKYIWRRDLSVVSSLYVVNKYFGLVHSITMLWIMVNVGAEAEICKKIYLWVPVGTMILTLLPHALMASRVYAIYGLSKVVLSVLGTIMAAEFATHTYLFTTVFPLRPLGPNIPIPCVVDGAVGGLIAYWAVPLVFDTVAFILTLYKTFRLWREEMRTPTINIIFRDGFVYFAAIFAMNLINFTLFVTQKPDIRVINLPATVMLNIIMSCRLVLNIRKHRPGVQMTGSSAFSSREERQVSLWNSPIRLETSTYEHPSNNPTSGGSIVVVKTESHV